MTLNNEGVALLRALIFKMWDVNQLREHGDCAGIAGEINLWLMPGTKITGADVQTALGRDRSGNVSVNVRVLRTEIDKLATLYSARLNGDYQAILNEVVKLPGLAHAQIVDVVEAMALHRVAKPDNTVAASAKLIGESRL